jgi:hypothetical protein
LNVVPTRFIIYQIIITEQQKNKTERQKDRNTQKQKEVLLFSRFQPLRKINLNRKKEKSTKNDSVCIEAIETKSSS